jgi:hypothetical protein
MHHRCRIAAQGIGCVAVERRAVVTHRPQARSMTDNALRAQIDDGLEQRTQPQAVAPGRRPLAFRVEHAAAGAVGGIEIADQVGQRHGASYFFK